MKKLAQTTFFLTILLMIGACSKRNNNAETILIDTEYLELTKLQISKNDPNYQYAFKQLIKDAEKALYEGPFSVTDKKELPPSGDKHDYVSYGRYWWPDPNMPNCLPYTQKDGETYPESQNPEKSDRLRINTLGVNTETLGLAYYLTGEQKYAKKAAELLRVWFLDEKTKMNPNANHAQCIPGRNNGSKYGVLDGRLIIRALEGSLLIKHSSALSDTEFIELKKWVKEYFEWLATNELALKEAASNNNHGSYYDVQAIYLSLYSENYLIAKLIAEQFVKRRIVSQIRPNGFMPQEMMRTRPLFYSIYNLHAMFLAAKLAERVGVDIWETNNQNSRLRAALNFLLPYTDPNKVWPLPTIGSTNRMGMLAILQMANRAYPNENYLQMVQKLPLEKCRIERINLAFPLMR